MPIGCLGDTLQRHGFEVQTREYFQQTLFPSAVILTRPMAGMRWLAARQGVYRWTS